MSRHQPEPPLACGTILGETYCLDRVLGQGGMGTVYLARDLVLERAVAVKILRSEHAADARIADLFRREAIAMASICHANVVQVYDTGLHGRLPFFVMEFVPGRTVAALIREAYPRRKVIGLGTVGDILYQVSRGITFMRKQGIFHGDVKPSNMLVDAASRVVISDFGLVGSARPQAGGVERRASKPAFLGGTPLYIAPELACGAVVPPEKHHLCDLYSLGASVFEMLTGHGPFGGATVRDVLRGHLFTTPPKVSDRRPDLPPAIDAVLEKALAKNPHRRFQSFIQLSAELDRVVRLAA